MAQQSEWLPMGTRLPKDGQRCIVIRQVNNTQHAPEWDVFYRSTGWQSSLGGVEGTVTHWMACPAQPPKVDLDK